MQSFASRHDDRWTCDACGSAVRTYRYRYYPPESTSFERCIGFFWCGGCRVYTSALVYVPRGEELVDLLAGLPPDEREHVLRGEIRLIAYIDERMSRAERG